MGKIKFGAEDGDMKIYITSYSIFLSNVISVILDWLIISAIGLLCLCACNAQDKPIPPSISLTITPSASISFDMNSTITQSAVLPSSTPTASITYNPKSASTQPKSTPTPVSTSTVPPLPSPYPTTTFTVAPLQTPLPELPSGFPALGWIAFANEGTGGNGIDIIHADGSGHMHLTGVNVYQYIYNQPAWSPDGQWIVFQRRGQEGGFIQLYKVGVDGKNLIQLTYDDGGKLTPSWSPDGKKIAYTGFVENQEAIFVIDQDGKNPKALLNSTNNERFPTWSPDGQMIAYLYSTEEGEDAIRAYPSDLYIINADGSNNRFVIGSVSWISHPAWSPDSKQIVFQSFDDCGLYIVNTDGSGLRMLTNTTLNTGNPTWSPDGKFIAFSARAEPCLYGGLTSIVDMQLYIIGADGTGMVPIRMDPDTVPINPAWSPVPRLQMGTIYTITPAGADLNLRESPSLNAKVTKQLKAGDTIIILEGPVEADYYYWWRMRTSDGVEGWAVDVLGWYAPVSDTATPSLTPTP